MRNPLSTAFEFQRSMIDSAVVFNRSLFDAYLRVLRQQQDLFGQALKRRAEDVGRSSGVQGCGPDLKDHYGRRSHDVDVERV